MSAELRAALRDALVDEPTFALDPAAIAEAGGHRVRRRRTRLTVTATAVSTAAVVAAAVVVARPGAPDPTPAPAEIVHLDLHDADDVSLDVLASTRTAWNDGSDAEFSRHDRFEGLTADGLVLRNRRAGRSVGSLLGLLDPRTGTTDWLPNPPGNLFGMQPLALDADRLVIGIAQGNGHSVLIFDRAFRTWKRDIVRVPYGIEVHVPPRMVLASDERLHVGSTLENQPGPVQWWSVPVPGGGTATPEPELAGADVAWSGPRRLVADAGGRVAVSTSIGTQLLADERPTDCEPIEEWPDAPVRALLAGERAVVTWFCASGPLTVVYEDGQDEVHVAGALAHAADEQRLVVSANRSPQAAALGAADPEGSGIYVVDLERRGVQRIADIGPWETQVALDAGLLLWNTPGPTEDRDTYDVVWKVAALD